MYPLDGVPRAKESAEVARRAPKETVADNTRFVVPEPRQPRSELLRAKLRDEAAVNRNTAGLDAPLSDAEVLAKRRAEHRAAQPPALADLLAAGDSSTSVDAASQLPPQSPRVRGYGLVSSPNPEPGVDASPMMTWGELGATPQRLLDNDAAMGGGTGDDDDALAEAAWLDELMATASSEGGPNTTFRISATPQREAVLHGLAAKVAERKRQTEQRRKRARARTAAQPLSNAGVKLARSLTPHRSNASSSGFGASLRASYRGDTPSRTPNSSSFSLPTPRNRPLSSVRRSTTTTPSQRAPQQPTPTRTDNGIGLLPTPAATQKTHKSSSLTDNLL